MAEKLKTKTACNRYFVHFLCDMLRHIFFGIFDVLDLFWRKDKFSGLGTLLPFL